jgi:pimeloyl-ACP methyl ester carboxylesterase
MATDFSDVCQSIAAPTLIVTGERHLDRVVPVGSSLEYLKLIAGSRHVTLPSTGHLGLVIKPQVFAEVVSAFITSTSPGSRTIYDGHEATQRTP